MPIQSSGGAMAHVLRSGHGPQEALVLHCMLAQARALEQLMAKLAADLSMLAMDLPGHGLSEDWDTSRDYSEMSCDMAAGLLERPAHLIGHSFGAYIALRIAVERPELVRSLTLIEPVFFAAAKYSDPSALKAYKRESNAFMGAMAVGDTVTAARAFTAEWGDGRSWESLKPDAMSYITDRMRLVAATTPELIEDRPMVWDKLSQIDMPCLLIEGEASAPIVASILDALETQSRDARRVQIAGAGHMSPMSHAVEVAEAISEFIAAQPLSAEIS
ncbi:MAG: alpha/beta hydrolase [Pseudomonadota bacterium]